MFIFLRVMYSRQLLIHDVEIFYFDVWTNKWKEKNKEKKYWCVKFSNWIKTVINVKYAFIFLQYKSYCLKRQIHTSNLNIKYL